MARYFSKIGLKEFKDKVDLEIQKQIDLDDSPNWARLTKTIIKDLSKVNFDTENISIEDDYGWKDDNNLLGYQKLDNGMVFMGCNCGGDWETALYFIIYFDGKKLRGYIPTKGNTWNINTKEAMGNDDREDEKFLCKMVGEEYIDGGDSQDFMANNGLRFDCKLLIEDIKDRILPLSN